MNKLLKEVPVAIRKYLHGMDDYDDPCFILIHTEQNIEPLLSVIELVVDDESPYSKASIKISETMHFLSVDCEHETVSNALQKIDEVMSDLNIIVYQSAFRHNCLGTPEKTFSWCCQLLDEVREEFAGNNGYKVNDFQDRGNWPGIEKYIENET